MAAHRIAPGVQAEIERLAREGQNKTEVAQLLGLSRGTVEKYWPNDRDIAKELRGAVKSGGPKTFGYPSDPRVVVDEGPPTDERRHIPIVHPWKKYPTPADLPLPSPEAGGPDLPEPVECRSEPHMVDTPGQWLVLSDIHIPYHDPASIRAAVAEGKQRNVSGILLNGDILDFYGLSRFCKDPSKPRLREEIEKGRQFLEWLRGQFPQARMIFKEGNHDERLRWYLADQPQLFDLPELQLNNLLRADQFGLEWVADKRAVHIGRLPIFHGHEFSKGEGVNPARWLFIRTVSTGACGHFHRSSFHKEYAYDGRLHGTWSFGCLCYLKPLYFPNNKWNHGYAFVDLSRDGHTFQVQNRDILRDGRVV